MEYTVKSGSPEKQRIGCVVVAVYAPRKLSTSAKILDKASGGLISNLVRRGELEGDIGQTLLLHNVENTLCDRILLVAAEKKKTSAQITTAKLTASWYQHWKIVALQRSLLI